MSSVMLDAILRMPPELWSGDPIDVIQRHSRYVQAANEIQALREALKLAREALESIMLEGIIPDGFKLLRSQAEESLNKMDALGK